MGCLDEEITAAFARGQLTGSDRAGVESHISGCEDCRFLVATAVRDADGAGAPDDAGDEGELAPFPKNAPAEPTLARGTSISRYVVGALIGQGGGGAVYEAHDTELRRRVGLKLLRPLGVTGLSAATEREHLLREARSLAQLAHPNVVAVHDVGAFEGQVYVVMEFVEGETLGAWLRRPHTWQESVAALLEAGAGIEAAHRAGLVHRDFKPDNVLVGVDGRIRVTDFGLARPAQAQDRGEPAASTLGPGHQHIALLTGLAGTPGYMAPEQALGQPTDQRSDQFAFCVVLYRALYNRHPFGTPDGTRPAPPPPGSQVPAAVYQALMTGLRFVPTERHPSMSVLLVALSRAVTTDGHQATRKGRRRAVRWSVAMAGALAILWLWGPWRRGGAVPACGDGVVRPHVEECDDGNRRDGDGCSAQCLACKTGDESLVWPNNGHCYARHDQPATWDEARLACARDGGDLATLNTEPERTEAARLVSGNLGVWVGRRRTGLALFWVTGDQSEPTLEKYWGDAHDGQGDRKGGDRAGDCVSLSGGDNTPWGARPCDEPRPFLCEIVAPVIRPGDNHAYRILHRAVTWPQAVALCQTFGAQLAKPDDADENGFVAGQLALSYWLGARLRPGSKQFAWQDGTPITFHAFAPNEPDNADGRSECVMVGPDRLWHDRPCDETHSVVCEID